MEKLYVVSIPFTITEENSYEIVVEAVDEESAIEEAKKIAETRTDRGTYLWADSKLKFDEIECDCYN